MDGEIFGNFAPAFLYVIYNKSTLISFIGKYRTDNPGLLLSVMPIVVLLGTLITLIVCVGSDAVQDYSYYILGSAAAVCLVAGLLFTRRRRCLLPGLMKSARQILPAVPILLLIGTLSSTWMLSGVVPLLIDYGLVMLDPSTFLFIACMTCSVVSVVTGSSWTTIATIGVALMGVGSAMGYSPGWVAGAIISGAYFGDKVSPLSDTTVLAASTCGVPLFTHIRYLMLTSIPAMAVALAVYLVAGYCSDLTSGGHAREMTEAIQATFNISAWVLVIPALTMVMIILRAGTSWTLAVGSLAGLAGIWVFQPHIGVALGGGDVSVAGVVAVSAKVLFTSTSVSTGSAMLDPLVATGGAEGMLSTVWLVLSAMVFGGAMIGTGMLGTITRAITSGLSRARSLVATTVGSGLFLNSCTGDQYLSIIIGGNVYRTTYQRLNVKPQTLSRTLEDSISVTSVLIPWNSCGVTQSTVLGVATLTYMPFCIFNIMSPVMTMVMAWSGWRIHKTHMLNTSSSVG